MSRIARFGAGVLAGCSVLVLALSVAGNAAPLKGADAALEALRDPKAREPKGVGQVLLRDIREFQEKRASLPPDKAAGQWLELFQRYQALPADANVVDPSGEESLDFPALIRALPPPPAWDAIASGIEQQAPKAEKRALHDYALLLLGHTLQEDQPAQWRDVAAMLPLSAKGQQGEKTMVLRIHQLLSQRSGDPARIVSSWELMRRNPEAGGGMMPDLVSLVGPVEAEKILRRVLTTSSDELFPTGEGTAKLARKLALELVNQLKAPQWALATSLDAAPLYEALRARAEGRGPKFAPRPLGTGHNGGRGGLGGAKRRAAQVYFFSQILAGKKAEAVKLLNGGKLFEGEDTSYELKAVFSQVDDPSQQVKIAQFLREMLTKTPNMPLWQVAYALPAQAPDRQALVALSLEALKKQDLAIGIRRQLRGLLYQQLLALDRPLEAVPHLLALVTSRERTEQAQRIHLAQAIQLARLGHLLKNQSWFEQGLKLAKEVNDEVEELGQRNYSGDYEFAQLMVDVGRPEEAEKLYLEALRKLSAQENWEMMGQDLLTRLAGLYYHADRHADVLKLLTEAPAWGAVDVSDLMGASDYDETPVPHMAAAALASQGKTADATRILEAVIEAHPAFDPSYELLVKLKGLDALPFLEKRFELDKFQERPLIWKGATLLKAGRLDEAEAAIKAAIAIDPSDGEMHFGRRMRVYSVMAEIKEARGDKTQADFFKGVIQAIRRSEEADQFAAVGLLSRGIKMYEGALDYFSDAYCIQSRLAIRLAEQGRTEEAAERFKKAFELMPDSFGRVETHCFGCEGVFSSAQAELIAEKVFKEIAAKNPTKPQIHYLLGYLRESQNRPTEALVHYRQAVKLDPDYLNAWKKIAELGDKILLPPADRDAASLALFRLDPDGEGGRQLNNVASPKALWTTVAALKAKKDKPKEPAPLLVLPASKAAMEKVGQVDARPRFRGFRGFRRFDYYDEDGEGGIPTPGEALAQHSVIAMVLQLHQFSMQLKQQQAFRNGIPGF